MNFGKTLLRYLLLVVLLVSLLLLVSHAGSAAGNSNSPGRYHVDLTQAQFEAWDTIERANGRQLVDIEIRWTGSTERFSGIWHPVEGTVHTLIQGSTSDWIDFFTEMNSKRGRYLDVEVDYYGGNKKYSAIFLEDGINYNNALRTTNNDAEFQGWLDHYFRLGYSIVDFEAYTLNNGNDIWYAGVWVRHPRVPRTTLYYGLKSADVSQLLRPLAGRVIDFERYYSPLHGEYRYALIVAMHPGGHWAHWRNRSKTELDQLHAEISNDTTHLIDLETWASGGSLLYGAVWGHTIKSLNEVAPLPGDSYPVGLGPILSNWVNQFESDPATDDQGTIGIYAKNIRTGQAIAYRANEPFYLASATKVAIHIKLWREIQDGRLDPQATIQYTLNSDTPEPWFVDDRSFPGLTSCQCNPNRCATGLPDTGDFGNSFSLERLDRGMMQVSDNATTTMLVDHETLGLAHAPISLNQWLSNISGVGQGFGPITSIHDVDRMILWQGQVMAYPQDASFFPVPGWRFTPWFRGCGDGDHDHWGSLADYFGGQENIPRTNRNTGYERYYAMGLNSATPRAFGYLLEKFVTGQLLDEAHTETALSVLSAGSALAWHPDFPSHVTVRGKSGSQRGDSLPVVNTAVFRVGPDTIVLGVYTKDNSRRISPPDCEAAWPPTIRGCRERVQDGDFAYMPYIGYQLLHELMADLRQYAPHTGFGFWPGVVKPGEAFDAYVDVVNAGGGDALAFDVAFYASPDTDITTGDYLIGKVRLPGMAGGDGGPARLQIPFPAHIPPGDYYVGWIIDPPSPDQPYGEVGEINDCRWQWPSLEICPADQVGYDPYLKLIVEDHRVYLPLTTR